VFRDIGAHEIPASGAVPAIFWLIITRPNADREQTARQGRRHALDRFDQLS
jgi:hypothetical protein